MQIWDFCILAPKGLRDFSNTAKGPKWPNLYTSYEATYGLSCLVLKIFTKIGFLSLGTHQYLMSFSVGRNSMVIVFYPRKRKRNTSSVSLMTSGTVVNVSLFSRVLLSGET